MALLDDLLLQLEKIALSFDLPTLLHPVVIHFLMALPVVVLLLELMNLMLRKKAVGGVSFFLILLTVIAAFGAYATGLTDGQDAAFTDAAKAALGEHKLLGTYILFASVFVLFLKLLAMMGNKLLKALYIIVLIVFIVVMFKQGNEGGELVYEHGLNVKQVKTLDDKVFDLEDALEDALAKLKEKSKAVAEKVPEAIITHDTPINPIIPIEVKPEVKSVMQATGVEGEPQVPVAEAVVEAVETPVVQVVKQVTEVTTPVVEVLVQPTEVQVIQ